ncbi:MAG: nucleotidyltransferase family protein [Dysgonamonadaceae bacterium]|nr:nucleotidyltransferase family protein [Dysgonamonadaceae bacterium]MDD4728102.1 nucleotidyltransferase family protein [Dysgonamonadaceae bacterium]
MSDSVIHPLFLNLLSAAIWDKPANASLFEGIDRKTWKEISNMAGRQTVSALIADKALSLPKESLPPREQNLQFIIQIEQTETLSRKMIQMLSEITREYHESDVSICLLKGMGNAMNYPSPLLRNVGDIDFFIYRKGDYERSKECFSAKGFKIKADDDDHFHYSFSKEGVLFENHQRITFFDNKKYDNLFKEWENDLIEKENFTSVQIDGLTVKLLPVDMNAFFIFQHMFRHFVDLGVGFRQFCDWVLFLSKHRNEIDPVSFTAIAKSYALLYPMQVFARAAVKYLDASENIFPFEMITDDKHADWVISDILDNGNFGFYRSGKQRPKEKLRSMWFSYKSTLRRSKKFGVISPEHCRILPVTKLISHLKNGFK